MTPAWLRDFAARCAELAATGELSTYAAIDVDNAARYALDLAARYDQELADSEPVYGVPA